MEFNHIYFIGIGGISMSALAEIMIREGKIVSGSDRSNSHIIDKFKKLNIKINNNHNRENITNDIDLVVYTSAIQDDNPELIRAKELYLNIMDRAEFLGMIMQKYKNSVCISGTHGKTTTTGMMSSILIETNLDPTIFLGGEMDTLGGNLKYGKHDLLVTEACEYKRNFLKFNPTIGIILNIDADHLDYYKDLKDVENAFIEYANKIPHYGYLIVNNNYKHLFSNVNCNIVTFGLDKSADFYAENIKHLPTTSYSLMKNGEKITDINLHVFGEHNIFNSLASAATCEILGIKHKTIKNGLLNFKGTHRRYEYKGSYKGATLIDDYAHHPTEIIATLKTSRIYTKGKIITIFQPHTFSRTKSLLNEFSKALELSDEVILVDIYSAREIDTGEVTSKNISDCINNNNCNSYYAKSFDDAVEIVENIVNEGDTVITMGAGNVNEILDLIQYSKAT